MEAKREILIVEDEEETRELLVSFFRDQNYDIREAGNGTDALDLLKDKVPDLVITDLLLPGEHGVDLVRKIKDRYFIPVIIISGIYRAEEVRDVIENYFVEGFFEKPVDVMNLLRKVNVILND
jgi:DNA-binding NtrC family response regulator